MKCFTYLTVIFFLIGLLSCKNDKTQQLTSKDNLNFKQKEELLNGIISEELQVKIFNNKQILQLLEMDQKIVKSPITKDRRNALIKNYDNLKKKPNPKADYTSYIQTDFTELGSNILKLLLNSRNGMNSFTRFGIATCFTAVDDELALKLVEDLNDTDRPTLDTLLIKYPGTVKDSFVNIRNDYFKDRVSILYNITYDGVLLDGKFLDNSGNKIDLMFDIGKICPPKCKPPRIIK